MTLYREFVSAKGVSRLRVIDFGFRRPVRNVGNQIGKKLRAGLIRSPTPRPLRDGVDGSLISTNQPTECPQSGLR
jgi:hypothetical protein